MSVLFFDTETTDLPDYKSPPGPHQPHVVQLAAVLLADGEERSLATLIQPAGWKIHPKAEETHGITLQRAAAEGRPIADVVAEFDQMLSQATLVVAHNVKFDRLLMDSEYARLRRRCAWPATFCTMVTCTDILRLPGFRGYKWPRLEEAYRFFFHRLPAAAHDALADVRACQEIYVELTRRGLA